MVPRIQQYKNTPETSRFSQALVEQLERVSPKEGVTPSAMKGLVFGRFHHPVARFPVVYKPTLCMVIQGSKRVYLEDDFLTYDPLHFLLVTVSMPLEAEILEASKERPFLFLALDLDLRLVGELLLEMAEDEHPLDSDILPARTMYVSAISEQIQDAMVRLLRLLDSPMDLRILGPSVLREVFYFVLKSEQGPILRSLILNDSRAQLITKAVRYLQENFNQSLDISSIAKYAGMGESTLHHTFRKVVGMSPMQYLKKTRLHQARILITSGGLSVGEAAFQVGYGSASQFTREFKRQFGLPPSRALETLQS